VTGNARCDQAIGHGLAGRILAYAGSKKAAEDVGFYYAANAAGRLFGIVLSGALALIDSPVPPAGVFCCRYASATARRAPTVRAAS
jgi:hypothetical protein